MKITHRLPWNMSYAYTEVVYDTDDPEITGSLEEALTNIAYHAVSLEQAFVDAGGGPQHPDGKFVQEAEHLGATHADVQRQQQAGTAAPTMQTSLQRGNVKVWPGDVWSKSACGECGYEMLYKPRGNRRLPDWASGSLDCTGGCKNDKGYPASQLVKKGEEGVFLNG